MRLTTREHMLILAKFLSSRRYCTRQGVDDNHCARTENGVEGLVDDQYLNKVAYNAIVTIVSLWGAILLNWDI